MTTIVDGKQMYEHIIFEMERIETTSIFILQLDCVNCILWRIVKLVSFFLVQATYNSDNEAINKVAGWPFPF